MLMRIFNLVIAILLFAVMFTAIDDSTRVWAGKEDVNSISVQEIAGGYGAEGETLRGGLFTDFIFPFELLSLLLLAALIGALYLAKKEAA